MSEMILSHNEVKQLMCWCSSSSVLNGETTYAPITGTISSDATLNRRKSLIPTNGFVYGAIARVDSEPLGGDTWVLTLLKNGSPTAITITLTTGSYIDIEDSANKVEFAKGDELAWRIVPTGTPAGLYIQASLIIYIEEAF